jgi:hypothetical protein
VHVIDAEAISHGRRAHKARQIIDEVESDLGSTQRSSRSGVLKRDDRIRGGPRRPGIEEPL